MINICMKIQYNGKRYSGWQKQGNTNNTIQGKMEKLLSKLFDEMVEVNGSGRTDAGVHAKGQMANFKVNNIEKYLEKHYEDKERTELSMLETINTEALRKDINKYLPADIRVMDLYEVDIRFHARLSAKRKFYRYIINYSETEDVFMRDFSYFIEKNNETVLDIEKMKKAAELLCGTHDFKAFCDNKHMKKSTVRNVQSIEIDKRDNFLYIDFSGDGFLYHMVRLMVGALIDIGVGKNDLNQLQARVDNQEIAYKTNLVPACGLYLMDVYYN